MPIAADARHAGASRGCAAPPAPSTAPPPPGSYGIIPQPEHSLQYATTLQLFAIFLNTTVDSCLYLSYQSPAFKWSRWNGSAETSHRPRYLGVGILALWLGRSLP